MAMYVLCVQIGSGRCKSKEMQGLVHNYRQEAEKTKIRACKIKNFTTRKIYYFSTAGKYKVFAACKIL